MGRLLRRYSYPMERTTHFLSLQYRQGDLLFVLQEICEGA